MSFSVNQIDTSEYIRKSIGVYICIPTAGRGTIRRLLNGSDLLNAITMLKKTGINKKSPFMFEDIVNISTNIARKISQNTEIFDLCLVCCRSTHDASPYQIVRNEYNTPPGTQFIKDSFAGGTLTESDPIIQVTEDQLAVYLNSPPTEEEQQEPIMLEKIGGKKRNRRTKRRTTKRRTRRNKKTRTGSKKK